MNNDHDNRGMRRRDIVLGASATVLAAAWPVHAPLAAEEWRKVTAFGVELEVPASWKRREYQLKRDDHEEVMIAEKAPDISTGAWFSVFPGNEELFVPERAVQPTTGDVRPARLTDFLTRAE